MKWGHAVRVRKGTILYAAGVLACGNVLLQVLGFVYRVVLSRFAGAEGLGVYRIPGLISIGRVHWLAKWGASFPLK